MLLVSSNFKGKVPKKLKLKDLDFRLKLRDVVVQSPIFKHFKTNFVEKT